MFRVGVGILGLMCLTGAGTAIYATTTADEPLPPGVYAEQPILNFGELAQTDTVTGEFQLVNRHPTVITIREVLTGCSCTEAKASHADVTPPGERFTVGLKWSVGTRRGPLKDAVSVSYSTADGQRHLSELALTARVKPDLEFTPARLEFQADEPGTQTVTFTPGLLQEFELTSASIGQSAFKVTLNPDGTSLTVTFDPSEWHGIGAEPTLIVGTSSTRAPYIAVPLRVKQRVN